MYAAKYLGKILMSYLMFLQFKNSFTLIPFKQLYFFLIKNAVIEAGLAKVNKSKPNQWTSTKKAQ